VERCKPPTVAGEFFLGRLDMFEYVKGVTGREQALSRRPAKISSKNLKRYRFPW
jgi:hypothetical protein